MVYHAHHVKLQERIQLHFRLQQFVRFIKNHTITTFYRIVANVPLPFQGERSRRIYYLDATFSSINQRDARFPNHNWVTTPNALVCTCQKKRYINGRQFIFYTSQVRIDQESNGSQL